MRKLIIPAFFGILLFAFSSCTVYPYLYIPSSLNMPLATNKGEIKGTVSMGSGGAELQGSYCIDSHVVVCITNTYGSIGSTNELCNISGGYYKHFSRSGRFEIIGGGGYAITNSRIENSSYGGDPLVEVHCQFPQIFAQADLGLVKKNVELGIGLRACEIFTSGTAISKTFNHGIVITENITSLDGTALFIDPCVMISYGGKNIKVHIAAGFSGRIFGREFPNLEVGDFGFSFSPVFASLGLTFNLFRHG